jgi:hypothetical protein
MSWTIWIELDDEPATRSWNRARVDNLLAWKNFDPGEVSKLKWIEWGTLPT